MNRTSETAMMLVSECRALTAGVPNLAASDAVGLGQRTDYGSELAERVILQTNPLQCERTPGGLKSQNEALVPATRCPLSGAKRTFIQLTSMSAFDPKRTLAYLFCRNAVRGSRTVTGKGRQQHFGPKEQILARITAQTDPAVTPQTNPASRPLKVVKQQYDEQQCAAR